MRRHWSQRVSAVLFAIWFAIAGLEPGALGACPAHGLSAGHAGHGMAGSGHMMDHMAAHGHHSAPASHHGHQCTCPDCGCCAVAVTAPSAPVIPAPAAVLAAAPRMPKLEVRPARVDFVLPFSNAPPRAVSI